MAPRKSYLLRISPELFDAVQRWADDELRSVNGQIEFVLADALRKAGRLTDRQSGRQPDRNARDDT